MSTEIAIPELTVQQRAVAAFAKCKTEKELTELAAKHADIMTITNKDGRDQVHAARMVLKNERVAITKYGEKIREEAVQFSKGTIAEQKRLIGLIEPEETRLEKLQKTWDDAREAERLAAVRAEEKRVADIQDRVAELSGVLNVARRYSLTAVEFAEHIGDLEAVPVDESFQEFREAAEAAKASTLKALREMHATADAREKEDARLKAVREQLDREKAEQEAAAKAERERIAEEGRVAKAARDAETARQNEELRKQRQAQEAEAARVKAEQAAEAKRLAEQQAEIARQQEEIRKAQEPPPAPPPPPPAPVSRRGVAVPVPKAEEIIEVLAKHYRARPDTIIEWLRAIDWSRAEAA